MLWILAGATVFGGLVGALALLPRVIVSPPSIPIDPRNNLSVSFDITNSSVVPLRDVCAAVAVASIDTDKFHVRGYKTTHGDNGGPGTYPDFDNLPRFERPEWKHHSLGMDERFTINIGGLTDFQGQLAAADMAITVTYMPWMLPFHRQKVFRYTAYRDPQGNMYWESWPLREPRPGSP